MGKYINQNENLNEYTMTQKVDHLYTFQYIKNIFIYVREPQRSS